MQVSAEIRWFSHGIVPRAFKDWFCNNQTNYGSAAGGVKVRVDRYLHDRRQVELGIKLRGGKSGVEVKGLVAVISHPLTVGPFEGKIEIWTKWTTEALELPPNSLLAIEKRRWLRKFDTTAQVVREIPLNSDERPLNQDPLPNLGCNVELTEIKLPNDDIWWTFSFEAFGTIDDVENSIRNTAALIVTRQPVGFEKALTASYPTWLKDLAI